MVDCILKKRGGGELSQEEIEAFVHGTVTGEIPDYQLSAMLMAIYFQGMTPKETSLLTMAMARSGETVDLSPIPGVKVDKHSTGGVGDKTTLVVAPIVASLGVRVAKMSGRGLGHTGGTVDKMESIPGLRTDLSREEFFRVVRETGMSVIGQSGNLDPADKRLYALRDVTGTVESLPLIASSIMSKKIAAGSDRILLDVKTGSGAFMKTVEQAVELAREMVSIGEHVGRRTAALITDMNSPLGHAVGNALEIAEVCDTLRGRGPEDLTHLCVELAANMLVLAETGDLAHCRALARAQLHNGEAFQKFKEFAAAQGGDVSVLEDCSRFPQAAACRELLCPQDGFLTAIDTELCGLASVELGAGREKKGDPIDYSAGILLRRNVGDRVQKGDLLAVLYAATEEKCRAGADLLQSALSFGDAPPAQRPLVLARVTGEGVELTGQELYD